MTATYRGKSCDRQFAYLENSFETAVFQAMSQPRVTITVGQGGQRSATISSSKLYSDHPRGPMAGRKRSVKDRLGSSSKNVPCNGHLMTSKRQQLETGWKQEVYDEEEENFMIAENFHKMENLRQDLRYKLDQKCPSKSKQISSSSTDLGNDLRERISGPLPHVQGQRIVVRRHPSLPSKAMPFLGPLPAAAAIGSRVKAVHKVSVAIEQPTVATLLQSLGLGKYSITFQAEEIDMTALRNMNDDDLKELGLPMGPRKKILIALSSRK
ncbi:hypothetical protein GOP47_0018462 [Adiantum capillus-veneris]|uniref:SAM domain-containing protein n=1 Tax=Adiantum capillus-veneris TaxID=13818 RepID=A0A9D4UE53_ADICA|nr:hypothetical protein GOP47_0018462 [Adiantum capillus-veneris]